MISGIYRNQPVSRGVNKSQVWNGRASDMNRKPRTNMSVKGADVFLVTGMLSLRTIRHNAKGYYVSVNGTDYPVRQLGSVWIQDGVSLDSLRLALHPKERQDRGHVNRPIPYREGHAVSKVNTYKPRPTKRRNLKTEYVSQAREINSFEVAPSYKKPITDSGVVQRTEEQYTAMAKRHQEFKDRTTERLGVTPELEAWLKEFGK